MDISKIKIGDGVKARTWTREGRRTITRTVTGFDRGRVTVSFSGYKEFILHDHEIIEHYPAEVNP